MLPGASMITARIIVLFSSYVVYGIGLDDYDIPVLLVLFERATRQSMYQVFLSVDADSDRYQDNHGSQRGHLRQEETLVACKSRNHNGQRGRIGVGQGNGKKEIVPGEDDGEQRSRS